ncbi:MAG: BamA/TamA family outer membrane protein, partial [Acidobacteriota bacterium]
TDLRQEFNENDSTVDFTIVIDEGKPFTIRRIEFKGNTITRDQVLRREILVNEGDLYNQELFDLSRLRLNQLGYFEEIKEEDVQFQTDERNGQVEITLKVKEKGRQQISFTGGVSGIGGSFIGISYSTNNLFGYGESLSFEVAAGNRQRNFSVSFTEPYLRGRPISLGFSVFTSRIKFFGGGLNTGFLGAGGLFGGGATTLTDSSLFTQDSTGFSVTLSAPLTFFTRKYLKYTRFTRVGLSYGFSSTKVTDPPANRDNDPTNDIIVTFSQPDITSSTLTTSLVYNTLNNPIDPTGGKSLSAVLRFSGLGGDVRVISPSLEIKAFNRVLGRERPHVFGQRFLIEHVSSFGSRLESNSLAFVGGVPIFNRYFLGGEDSIRGFNVRSISPIAQVERFQTTSEVQARLPNGKVLPVLKPGRRFRGIDASVLQMFTFNNRALSDPNRPEFTPIGADTQLLYNAEYRIPLAGPLSFAFFLDAGTVFNTGSFDDDFLTTNKIPELLAGFVINPRGRIATPEEIAAARTPETPPTELPKGFRFVTINGNSVRTSAVRLSRDIGGFSTNFRASIGGELRVQVPVVGVPFRLIFAYNPNAKTDANDPKQIFLEQKRTVRFSIGRTF